jgi:hypothetical protein
MIDTLTEQPSAMVQAPLTYRAVQIDMSISCVDWPVVHSWSESDESFVGMVTVQDVVTHAERAAAEWSHPTDEAADAALAGAGFRRAGEWETDWTGRRTAMVQPWPAPARSRMISQAMRAES